MTTSSGRTSSAKPWNTKMDRVDADEELYVDYKDELTNLKFKTTTERMGVWIIAHKEQFPDPDCWDIKPTCTTLRVKDSGSGTLMIKFHSTTGVVLIQGFMHQMWRDRHFAVLQHRVSQLRLQTDAKCDGDDVDTKLKTVVGIDGDCDVDTAPDDESIDTSDGEVGGDPSQVLEPRNDMSHCDNEILKTVECAYTQFCDLVITEIVDLHQSVKSFFDDVKKIPIKVSDRIKKDIESLKVLHDEYNKLSAENDYLKSSVKNLIEETQAQFRELWDVKREMADLKAIITASSNPPTPPRNTTTHITITPANTAGYTPLPQGNQQPSLQVSQVPQSAVRTYPHMSVLMIYVMEVTLQSIIQYYKMSRYDDKVIPKCKDWLLRDTVNKTRKSPILQNPCVHDVNARVLEYCVEKDLVYIKHSKLQSPNAGTLFHDDVLESDSGGTVVLVSNIQHALRNHGAQIASASAHEDRVFYNRTHHSTHQRNLIRMGRTLMWMIYCSYLL